MTLGVLAAYRNHGIGSKLVKSILDYYESEKDGKLSTVDEIMVHTQTSNTDAMKFYMDRFGFEKGELVENYYKRIDPPHCYILLLILSSSQNIFCCSGCFKIISWMSEVRNNFLSPIELSCIISS